MHAFSSESIPPRGLSLTHLAGKGLLVACHGHEAEKLAGMARIYIYPEPDLRPAYFKTFCVSRALRVFHGSGPLNSSVEQWASSGAISGQPRG